MANKVLNGNDWSTAGDWDGGAKPVSNDNASIQAGSTNIIMSGDEGGVDLDSLIVPRRHTGSFGTSGSPLAIAGDEIKYFGAGGFFFNCDDDGITGLTTDRVYIEAANAQVPFTLGTAAGANTGDYDQVHIARGDGILASTFLFAAGGALNVGYVTNRASDVRLVIETTDTIPLLQMNGGFVTNKSTTTEAHVAGSRLQQKNNAATTIAIYAGGVVELEHTAATEIYLYPGGTLNLMTNNVFKTITTLWQWPGSTLIRDPNLHTITNDHHFGGVRTSEAA